ncbi:MAG: Peptidase legumain asparaginyl peptidase [Verrucomicrobiaceae bacterium]|nr:Peptidase legumain asparaginyl peptidase [Verrucomicrobiaceae bacterium]
MAQSEVVRRFINFKSLLLRNLLVGVKAALLRPLALNDIGASWFQIAALLLLSFLPSLVAQLLDVGWAGEFSSYGLPGILFPFPAIFILAVLAAKLLNVDAQAKAIILTMLSASIVIDAADYSLPYILKHFPKVIRFVGPHIGDLTGYWLGAVFAVVLLRVQLVGNGKKWIVLKLIVTMPAAFILAWAMNDVWRERTVWSVTYDEEQTAENTQDYYAAVSEEILYLQPQLLADHLNKLKPGQAGTSNLYFLGVAGYAEQGVFMREIRSVKEIILPRFSTEDHSLLLVNNKETLKTEPIATTTSIQMSVAKIGEVMDKDNDILFVYLTSHGSKQHKLSLSFIPLQIKDLDPIVLRKILDDAGIQWRVIVVSACYSGGFIEPLADDKTLVITAAAADRTSFGCSDENDYTYFGRAYFEEALSKTNSLIDAFDLARDIVTKRELDEQQTPSNPQISVGKEMREKLSAFEKTIH